MQFTKRKSMLSIVLCLVASCVAEPSTGDVASQVEPAPERSTANYEIDFMTDMIDHHQMAIEMAELCLEKAVHEELLELCSNIIATQSSEIETMQGWLEAWYGVSHEPTMKPGAMRSSRG